MSYVNLVRQVQVDFVLSLNNMIFFLNFKSVKNVKDISSENGKLKIKR